MMKWLVRSRIKILLFCLCCIALANTSSANELTWRNLRGINHVIVTFQFNGISFGEAYLDKNEERLTEYNFNTTAAKLKSQNIPLTKNHLQDLYRKVGFRFDKISLQLLKRKNLRKKRPSVIPTLYIKMDIINPQEDQFIFVVHLALAKWMSQWATGTRIYAPAYIWSRKQIFISPRDQLSKNVKQAVMDLTGVFINEYKRANKQP